jgi:hypothetical protein
MAQQMAQTQPIQQTPAQPLQPQAPAPIQFTDWASF